MSCYARLDNFQEAERAVFRAREFYADHLGLSGEFLTKFVKTGCLIDELQPVGDRAVQTSPWLYFIMGHACGPSAPGDYIGETDSERGRRAMEAWSSFFEDSTPISGSFAHLLFANGQHPEAARHVERLLLVARKYETVSPIRIEFLWPCFLLGECYWASNQKEKAGAAWRRARSVELCHLLDNSDLDDWEKFAVPWIDKAKSSLAEHDIAVPLPEASLKASQHLLEAIRGLYEAEQFEARGVDPEELLRLIRQAGRKYTIPLEYAKSELELVERLDLFTWAKNPVQGSSYWWRYESVKGFLLQKMALVHLSNEKLALAIASYKQANDLWPTLSSVAVMGGLQAACGLIADAKSTYINCIARADEFGATESSEDREQTLREVRQALRELE
jgi:tetratricopeptide (TPR) repeat protein